ncbi:MAG: alpha/beta hydrolase-fold protein [Cytophagales bacterium]|nr:alpha/beta hydrolase-fold protein [Cytophagales bacterium]
MKTIKHRISIFQVLFLLSLLIPQSVTAQVISKAPEDLFIVGSESIVFKSEVTDSDYRLYVNLPENYAHDSDKTYPVYYALDGNRTFVMSTQIYQSLRFDGFAPEVIIVGITYGGSKADYGLNRSRDLTPTNIELIPTSGGAANFLKMLREELIPFIDQHFRTDPTNRTLAGTSFAGLFTHYTLFNEPTLFNNYLINNPTFWWEEDYGYKLEEAFYQKRRSLNARVLYTIGAYDAVEEVIEMVNQIREHDYANLSLGFREVDHMGHMGGEAEAINQGMRFAYRLPEMKLPKETLEEYCGTYQDGSYVREVVISQGDLHLVRQGQTTGTKIQATSPGSFALQGTYFDFHFKRNEEGKVIGFSYQRDFDGTNIRTAAKVE